MRFFLLSLYSFFAIGIFAQNGAAGTAPVFSIYREIEDVKISEKTAVLFIKMKYIDENMPGIALKKGDTLQAFTSCSFEKSSICNSYKVAILNIEHETEDGDYYLKITIDIASYNAGVNAASFVQLLLYNNAPEYHNNKLVIQRLFDYGINFTGSHHLNKYTDAAVAMELPADYRQEWVELTRFKDDLREAGLKMQFEKDDALCTAEGINKGRKYADILLAASEKDILNCIVFALNNVRTIVCSSMEFAEFYKLWVYNQMPEFTKSDYEIYKNSDEFKNARLLSFDLKKGTVGNIPVPFTTTEWKIKFPFFTNVYGAAKENECNGFISYQSHGNHFSFSTGLKYIDIDFDAVIQHEGFAQPKQQIYNEENIIKNFGNPYQIIPEDNENYKKKLVYKMPWGTLVFKLRKVFNSHITQQILMYGVLPEKVTYCKS